MTERLLSSAEAAQRLGVSIRRVQALITAGKIPATRVGRTWVIKESDITLVSDRPQGWPKGRPRKSG